MRAIGTIAYVTKGLYDPSVTYKEMDVVLYSGSLWEPKKETTGNAPPETQKNEDGTPASNEWWKLFLPGALGDDYIKKTDIAKAPTETEAGKLGIVMPDGKTIQIDENGLLTGTPIDFMGTPKALQEAIQSGEVTEGMNLFIEDAEDSEEPDPDHPNNMLFPLDDFLSTVSSNAVMNRVLTNALNRLEQLENETRALRSTLTEFGLSKICPVDVTDVTEDNGMVLGAKEKNPSIEGTLSNFLNKIDKNSEISIYHIADISQTIAESSIVIEQDGTYFLYARGLTSGAGNSYLSILLNGEVICDSHCAANTIVTLTCERFYKLLSGSTITFKVLNMSDRIDGYQFADVVKIGKY